MRRTAWSRLSELADGRAPETLRRRVAAAVADDPELRALIATFAATLELLRECGRRSWRTPADEEGFRRCVDRVRAHLFDTS